ncbi:MAG: phosphatase PAP2 family protein [Candidatus Levybacteria bacterium]|nr:phosphatase PAP2 family protein [Candidatus Levybacteria bacterium]
MRKELKFFLVGIGFFLLFILFSYLVHKDFLTRIDFDTTVRLQNNITRNVDDVFSFFSDIGSFEPMLVIVIFTLIYWRKIISGIMLFGGFVGFHVIELFGKFFVDHPPPPEFMLRTHKIVQFDQFHVRTEFSYPSGHSGRAVFLATVLLFIIWHSGWSKHTKIFLSILVGVFVVIMLVSRIYLGEHWFSDVIGGGLLGFALGCMGLVFYYFKGFKKILKR